MQMSSATAEYSTKITAPYGSWKSPVTSDIVSGSDKTLDGTAVDSYCRLCWLESRPTESGRLVRVKEGEKEGDEPVDITPKEFSVRTVTQDYGGGAFRISVDTLIFSNYKDQRLYKQSISSKDSAPVPLTPDYGRPLVSYVDGVFGSLFIRYVTVQEDCRESTVNSITTITSFDLNDTNIPADGDQRVVESPTEPKWSSEGELFFITDRETGFWNLYKWNSGPRFIYVQGGSAVQPLS